MKLLLLLVLTFLPSISLAFSEESYEWKKITYETYLIDLKATLIIEVNLRLSEENAHWMVSSLNITKDGGELKVPKPILDKFWPIHAHSFFVSAADHSRESVKEEWISIHFKYGRSPHIREGTISFLNGEYKLYVTSTKPNS